MGNEGSKLNGLITDKNAVEVNDFWTLYNAESPLTSTDEGGGGQLLSIFKGDILVKGHLWSGEAGPMERAIKNLMVYRHPYILKYVATWSQSGQKYLATERVRPLNEVLQEQNNIQVCLGLRTILCSLIFLVEKALARHLNICTHSIYVTDSGSWRLAGFSYVWKAIEVNKHLLNLARSIMDPKNCGNNFEQFAFASLCEHVLGKSGTDSTGGTPTPYVREFLDYCRTHLKHQNNELRPKLSAVLLHPYFNHEFVLIHSFLFELPLKSVSERQKFFGSLIERLRYFEESVVASQLASNLLSRMVLLDPTAQQFVTPFVLRTKASTISTSSLFSPQTYIQYLLPHILKMFRLRDAQIRLILLDYFLDYVCLLNDEHIQSEILPHLQLGMNDTNDVLVAKTLKCMADLVTILGGNKVLGGDRFRYFSDGRPHAAVSTDYDTFLPEPRSITPLMNSSSAEDFMVSDSPLPTENNIAPLSLRLSPDGGEDENDILNSDTETNSNNAADHEKTLTNMVEEEVWSDWDNTDELHTYGLTFPLEVGLNNFDFNSTESAFAIQPARAAPKQSMQVGRQFIEDFSTLDIQVQSKRPVVDSVIDDLDYFKDMEPIIQIKNRDNETTEIIKVDANRFAAALSCNNQDFQAEANQGWGHDEEYKDDTIFGIL
ncbi:hypothetical protein KR009_001751 [Drosophila setifemur]|nr:hypothetical protein KR009_001751 [Drosophila setifemur]